MTQSDIEKFLNEMMGTSSSKITVITDIDPSKTKISDAEINEDNVPILPLRSMMIFPGNILPVNVMRKSSLRLITDAIKQKRLIGVFCQKDDSVDNPDASQLYETGVVAKVLNMVDLPDGTKAALLNGFTRISLLSAEDNGAYLEGKICQIPEEEPKIKDKEFVAIVDECKDVASKIFRSEELADSTDLKLRNMQNRTFFINFLCSHLPISNRERITLLRIDTIKDRAYKLLELLNRELQYVNLKERIQHKTTEDLSKQQREYFLQQEIRNIQEELGDKTIGDEEKFAERARQKEWSLDDQKFFEEEFARLKHIPHSSPEYQMQYNFVDTILSLPWNKTTKDNLNLSNAEKILNKDHYGMEKVKERILEHLAVLKMRGDFKSPIICLYGPPGVGKTSLGKSIAKAMKREYVRMSLGGVHDESEIRGHRKTYIGAMPGRILKCIQKAGSSNPVFILDEIDKVGQDGINGDPASALLEVLDPEQNVAFHDNYLDYDYDLSRVMFIATANNISTIPAPLLDRMELIEVSGYLTEEKMEIAKRHLVPQELEKLGMKPTELSIQPKAVEKIIEDYTRESGVRELDKTINKILRKMAFEYAKNGVFSQKSLDIKKVKEILGPEKYSRDKYQGNDYAGVVTGLAWTSVGGEILFIETSLSKGKGSRLTLTGNLGDVMKESATLALEYVKAHADMLNIDYRIFENWNIHIHVPEGAVPKDGPSAGITITTALASALTQRKVRKNLAMTGEMTLRGKVLPVGGIKEKILAAKRAGITDIIICNENEKDINKIPAQYLNGVTFHYVDTFEDVIKFALLDEKVAHPIDFTIDEAKDKEEKAN